MKTKALRTRCIVILLPIIVVFFNCSSNHISCNRGGSVSPLDFGLLEAKSDLERYDVLFRTHQSAVNSGKNVVYSGIDIIDIEIPIKSKPIPLSLYTDFGDCVINVKNNWKDVDLFATEQNGMPVDLKASEIDNGIIEAATFSKNGMCLVVIADSIPWVEQRKGYRYGHIRKDILLVKNGKAINAVVFPYSNNTSSPSCQIIPTMKEPLVIKNLTVNRDVNSNYITNIVRVAGYNDIRISNITINTPESSLHNDRAIRISNSTNVSLDCININGTYSQPEKSGYGIMLDNIWNFKGSNIYGKGAWGIFGNNNLNEVTLADSKINRFDVHCYGRNMLFQRVHFYDLYNQFASVYGAIVFEKCYFDKTVPFGIGTTYNSYVPCDVYFNDCRMIAVDNKNYILKLGINDGDENNKRSELNEKCWPNIIINGFNVNLDKNIQQFYIITNKEGQNPIELGYISNISIDGLTVKTNNSRFKGLWMSKFPLRSKKQIHCRAREVTIEKPDPNNSCYNVRYHEQIHVLGNNYKLD